MVLWCLLCFADEAAHFASSLHRSLLLFHVVEAVLLASSLPRSLRLFHVVEAVARRILHLLLLQPNFDVDALLVSTLLN